MISGTPTTAGSYSVLLNAANVGGIGTATLNVTVVNPLPVVTIVATAPVAVAGRSSRHFHRDPRG